MKNISEASRSPAAFTLIELLVVIAIIGILAALLLPVLQRAKLKTQGVRCMSNHKQLLAAWTTYSGDNNDKLVVSGGVLVQNPDDPAAREGGRLSQWVLGSMAISPGWTNELLIQKGLLWAYVKALGVYKCPGDPRTTTRVTEHSPMGGVPTLRSISMNCWLNPIVVLHGGRVMRKHTEITTPGPAHCWVTICECPWTINDGWFICNPSTERWIDYPSGWHNGGTVLGNIGGIGSLCYADGHAELRKWHSDRTDLPWLQERSTSKQN